MKDSEKMSYLFRYREQESNAEIKDNNSEKKTKEKESDK